jgi:dCMP deaminase
MYLTDRIVALKSDDSVVSCQVNDSIFYEDGDFYHKPTLIVWYSEIIVLEDFVANIDKELVDRLDIIIDYYKKMGYHYRIKQYIDKVHSDIIPIYDGYSNKYGEFKRLSLLYSFMKMSVDISERSTCLRRRVGCIIAPYDLTNISSIGYKGSLPKKENGCMRLSSGKCGCIHAEVNALDKFKPIDGINYTLFCTLTPCLNCSKEIVKYPITRVIYLSDYRDMSGYDFLKQNNIDIIKYNSLTK